MRCLVIYCHNNHISLCEDHVIPEQARRNVKKQGQKKRKGNEETETWPETGSGQKWGHLSCR
jgi:hypothetical protein